MGKLRAWAKSLLAHVAIVVEFCHDCGLEPPVVWHVDDALWARFADGQRPLCPDCFDRRARAQGVLLCWTAAPDTPLALAPPHIPPVATRPSESVGR